MREYRISFLTILASAFVSAIVVTVVAQPPTFAMKPPPVFPAKIFAIEPVNETDVSINFFVESAGDYRVLVSAGDGESSRVVGTGSVAQAGVYTWIGEGVLNAAGTRYYTIGVSLPHVPQGASDLWALLVQERAPGQRYLVSLPVDAGADPSLQGPIGRQLMFGLGAGASTNDSDELRFMTAPDVWESAFLVQATPGERQWRTSDLQTPSRLVVQPGHAFWVIRRMGAPLVTHKGIFAGPLPAKGTIRPMTFGLAGQGMTPFGIARQQPRVHRNTETARKYSTPADQLGFSVVGSAGATADLRREDERGDQIWVWRDNEWAGRYWLMGHLGERWDGKWWDGRRNDFAHFELEPGVGYYYIHRTNRWGGAAFEWQP